MRYGSINGAPANMKPLLLISLVLFSACVAAAQPRITYVGDGRYVCSDDRRACARFEAEQAARNYEREREHRERQQREDERRQRMSTDDYSGR
jgi:hypothetical protein